MRKRRKRKNRVGRSLFFTVLFLVGLFYLSQEIAEAPRQPQIVEMDLTDPAETPELPILAVGEAMKVVGDGKILDLSKVHSEAVLLKEFESGKTLVKKNQNKRIFPASLTKIMTTILAIEMVEDFERKIIMQPEYFEGLFEMEAAIAGFQPKEEVQFRDLLYGAMLPSGADACLAIAHLLAGSESAYVELMNERAAELGLKGTHFQNVTGLHHPENYSTVDDLYVLLNHALKNPIFYEVFTTPHYSSEPTNLNPQGVHMSHTLARYVWEYPVLTNNIRGAKTGFTEEAGQCLASLAEIDGTYYLLITTGAGAQPKGPGPDYKPLEKPFHLIDAATIYTQLAELIEPSPH